MKSMLGKYNEACIVMRLFQFASQNKCSEGSCCEALYSYLGYTRDTAKGSYRIPNLHCEVATSRIAGEGSKAIQRYMII